MQQEETQRVVKEMERQILEKAYEIGSGVALRDTADETAIKYATEVGEVSGMQHSLDFLREGFNDEDNSS